MKKTFFKVFWAWNEDKELAWLEEKSKEGWQLSHVFPLFYTFEYDPAKEYIYDFDFQSKSKRDLKDYVALLDDAGWSLVGTVGGWLYLRTEKDSGATPIFTDDASKAEKYRRLMIFLMLVTFPLLLNTLTQFHAPTRTIQYILFPFAVFVLYAWVRVIMRYNYYRKKSNS